MPQKSVRFFGKPVVLVCDGNCAKAWGLNGGRPKHFFSDNPDDYVYLPDSQVGVAPSPETWEGSDTRPSDTTVTEGSQMNKWCARACERCNMIDEGQEIRVKDMENPEPNFFSRRKVV